jgi:hypothetical protein
MPTSDEQLIALFGPGGAGAQPSGYDEGRFRPLPSSSALWAAFLGMFSLLFPPMSILGIRAALRAHRAGSRFSWIVAVVWCVGTAAGGIRFWFTS